MIDIDSIPKERERKIKEKIILDKFNRIRTKKMHGVVKSSGAAVNTLSKYGRRAVQKLYQLEQYYQKLKNVSSDDVKPLDSTSLKRIINEAGELVRQGEYIPAEKLYIEIISHNPKSVSAYEGLGNLYLKSGNIEQARETLLFTLRLAPEDASVNVSMAELEIKGENFLAATDRLRKAVKIRPKNPKYIDFYIETSLNAKLLKDVRKGLSRLKEVNPENKKIVDFEERFSKLKDEYVASGDHGDQDSSQDE